MAHPGGTFAPGRSAPRDSGAFLIRCTLRHFAAEQSPGRGAPDRRLPGDTRVGALDIAGDEAGYPVDAHLAAFRLALEHDLHRTAHAGEARGPESVWETLERFKPSRLGHGVRSMEDPALVDHLRRERIHLEICPTHNVQIDVYPACVDHPIDRLSRQGVAVGVNTDARAVTKVTLSEECERLAYTFGWRKADCLACNLNAMEAAFAPAEVKQRVAGRLQRRKSHEP